MADLLHNPFFLAISLIHGTGALVLAIAMLIRPRVVKLPPEHPDEHPLTH